MVTKKIVLSGMIVFCLLMFSAGVCVASEEAVTVGGISDRGWMAMAAAVAMTGAAIGAGIAVSTTGVAAAGATAEKPEVFGRVMIFVALAEAIAVYGLLIAFMIWTKI